MAVNATKSEALFSKTMKTPVGVLTLISNESALVAVWWGEEDPARAGRSLGGTRKRGTADAKASPGHTPRTLAVTEGRAVPVLKAAETQLREYFAGVRKSFDLPLDMRGTDFQKRVWRELQRIPYGETSSYAAIAKRIGRPQACRAVGAANGRNPISIIVPCHRVIGADGSLTGFGGGLEAKVLLLEHEARVAKRKAPGAQSGWLFAREEGR
jgi:methylated-DNA-[protein]-cysteine S-methyltransferase